MPEQDERPACFIIMPISTPLGFRSRYGDREDHFAQVLERLIVPAVREAGYQPKPPVRRGSENIQASIINDLEGADMVLADLSTLNANVFLELGIRTALDKPICLVWDGNDDLPFDTNTINCHKYDPQPLFDLNVEIAAMQRHLQETRTHTEDGRNVLWKYFGNAATRRPLGAATVNAADATVEAKLDRLLSLAMQGPTYRTLRNREEQVPDRFARSSVEDEVRAFVSAEVYQRMGSDARITNISLAMEPTGYVTKFDVAVPPDGLSDYQALSEVIALRAEKLFPNEKVVVNYHSWGGYTFEEAEEIAWEQRNRTQSDDDQSS